MTEPQKPDERQLPSKEPEPPLSESTDERDTWETPPMILPEVGESSGHDTALSPVYIPPKEPLQPGPHGVDIQFLIRSSQTGYQYSCLETAVAPKTLGPAPHLHETLDEIALVLEGTLSVMVEDTVYEVPAGGMSLRPRGLIHTFWNATDKPVRFLDMMINQNFDDWLEEFFTIREYATQNDLSFDDPDVAQRLAQLDREFEVTQFPEQRQAIIDKYELTG